MNGKEETNNVVCCWRCGYQLAREHGDEIVLRIKDQYIYIMKGFLKMLCRGCGTMNLVASEQSLIDNKPAIGRTGARESLKRPWRERRPAPELAGQQLTNGEEKINAVQ